MVNFQPPVVYKLLPFTVAALFLHCVGYFTVRAILIHHPETLLKLNVQDAHYVVYIFTLSEIVSLLIASIILEVVATSYYFIILGSMLWIFVIVMINESNDTLLSILILVICIGVISSALKISFLAYGAAEYESKTSRSLYVYFLFSYIAITLSELSTFYFVPPRNVYNWHFCNSKLMNCSGKLLIMLGTFAIGSTSIFYCSKYSFMFRDSPFQIDTSPVFGILNGKLWKILPIIVPICIIFIMQKQILANWPAEADLLSNHFCSYMFDRDYLGCVYLLCIVLFTVTFYYFFFYKFDKSLITNPIIAIIIGCLLMSLGTMTNKKLELGTQKYTSNLISDTQVSVIVCPPNLKSSYEYNYTYSGEILGTLPPYYCKIFILPLNTTKVTSIMTHYPKPKGGFVHLITTFSSVNSINPNPDIFSPFNSPYTKNSLVFVGLLLETKHERDRSGLAKLCVNCVNTAYGGEHRFVLYKINGAGENYASGLRYVRGCETFVKRCFTIMPGMYKMRDFMFTSPNYTGLYYFGVGGFYLIAIDMANGTSDVITRNLIEPLEISIIWLLFPMITFAVGEALIKINGLYAIYVVSNAKLKTVSIGIWLLITRSGDITNVIFSGMKNLDAVVVLEIGFVTFISIAVFFIIIAIYWGMRSLSTNWEPSRKLTVTDRLDDP